MLSTVFQLVLLAASNAAASPTFLGPPKAPACHELTLRIPVTATNLRFNLPTVDSNLDAVRWGIEDSRRTNVNRTTGEIPINQTFSIAAQLCVPSHGSKKSQIQILTHGQFANRKYWDVQLQPEEYSYVENALAAGYSVLNYDRLSVGASEHPDAYTVAQTAVEVEILRSLNTMAHNGHLLSLVPDLAGSTKFDKVINVGHSYGSIVTSGLLAQYGDLVDAAILTGFLPPAEAAALPAGAVLIANGRFAPEVDPVRWGTYASGYIANADIYALQTIFFSRRNDSDPAGFDNDLLEYAWNEVAAPITSGEWLSKSEIKQFPAPAFTGPILFLEGEHDLGACLADCNGAFNATRATEVYPNAKMIDYYVQPGAGHGLTLHRNASAGYKAGFDWLSSQGF
ncbi:hypothetical protein LTR15_006381 [Elasticomyces elasticus]|nr:hypothetical protein LTR15_006381 [Elasticomyces elasticus]